jgi:autotransporter-associated beta strand protein
LAVLGAASAASGTALLIDHANTDLRALNQAGLQAAKTDLHIAYGHTSHGSQVTDGMSALVGFINGGGLGLSYPLNFFQWNHGGTGGALNLHDYFSSNDLGNPNFTQWATDTRNYLNNPANADVNVIMWSWCGQVSWAAAADINTYLGFMDQLEIDFPNVSFVHMTGHTDGCAPGGNLMVRNQQIRDHCATHGEILFDFADIESWDPNGSYYGNKRVNDNCDYDSDGNGTLDRNWAIDWQNAHTLNVDWYSCSAAHTQPLNGNRKAYAAWALWNEIAALAAPATLTWKGGVDSKWDLGQTANWARSGVKRGYQEGDHVVLDDSGLGTLPISLAATVHPGSVLVNNNTVARTLGGAGSIAGACGLTKSGSATLTVAMGNAYTGETRINAGTLIVAAESALGSSAVKLGDTAGSSDASLLVSGAFTVDRPITVQDDGSGTSSRTLGGTHTAGTALFSGGLTLDNDLILTADEGGPVRLATGTLDNSEGRTLTKIGHGTVIFDGPQTHGLGALLEVNSGAVELNTDAGSDASANLSITVTGGVVNFGCDQHLDSLTLEYEGQAALAGAHVLVLKHLVIGGVDLGATVLTPEPATLALVALGGLGALLRRRRR